MSKVAQLFDMQNDKTVITVFAINIINVGGKHLKLKCVAIVVVFKVIIFDENVTVFVWRKQ